MGIHKHHKIILFRLPKDFDGVVNPFLVVDTGPFCFYSFPVEDVSNGVVTTVSQPLEMNIGVFEEEGSPDKGNVVAIKEPICDVRGEVRFGRKFGVGSNVDPSEGYLTVVFVFEIGAFYSQEFRHGSRVCLVGWSGRMSKMRCYCEFIG